MDKLSEYGLDCAALQWRDGQPYNEHYQDQYFAREGGYQETLYTFLKQNHLPERWQHQPHFTIAETGFGTGLNFIVTMAQWKQHCANDSRLFYFSAEKHPLAKHDLQKAWQLWPALHTDVQPLIENYPEPIAGFHSLEFLNGRVILVLMYGEALDGLSMMQTQVDAWYLDGFAPSNNPGMWSPELFERVASLSHEQTTFSTFTAAGWVRRGLQQAGFNVKKVPGFGVKRDMLRGQFDGQPQKINSSQPWFNRQPLAGTEKKQAIVIGAGIAGLSMVDALAKRGWQLSLIERHCKPAQEASGNLAGIVMPQIARVNDIASTVSLTAFLYTIAWLARLKTQFPDLSWYPSGVLQLTEDKCLAENLPADIPDAIQRWVNAQVATDIAGIPISQPSIYYAGGGWLNPESLCQVLLTKWSSSVARYFSHEALILRQEQNDWQVLSASGEIIASAPVIVLTSGSDVSRFDQANNFMLRPVKGQLSYSSATELSQRLKVPICYQGYITPAFSGVHCIGASYEANYRDLSLNRQAHQENLMALTETLPDLLLATSDSEMMGRAAIRCTSGDRLPLIGALPEAHFYASAYRDLRHGKPASTFPEAQYYPGLYVSVAHGSRGLTTSPYAAECIASEINHEPNCMPKGIEQALHPARFWIRNLKRGRKMSSGI